MAHKFKHFTDLQDRILAITERSEATLRDPQRHDTSALGQGRWEVTRMLREYQLYKHSMIFDPILRSGGERAHAATRMKAECVRMGEEFQQYVLKWSVVSIADRWDTYQPAALDAIARIRAHLKKERTGVAALLEA